MGEYPSERLEAEAIVNGYLSGMNPPFDGWHHIDNAHNDLLREIIKQLVCRALGVNLYGNGLGHNTRLS